jgi:para-nitrobenzyl esterase
MSQKETVVVETPSGKIRGLKEDFLCVFKGIPYAEPPVNELRFQPPVLKRPWAGILDCLDFGPMAPQRKDPLMNPGRELPQDEGGCLNLNIWTPGLEDRKRPVLFWIHGGGFSFGSGSWTDGSSLARQGDMVVVTINYRLGIFGFLFIENKIANLGMLDQIAALKWVNHHIASFGGDPNNVTLFGESAGAVAVCSLMAMPSAKGLFHKVISQSGTAHPRRHHPSSGRRGAAKIMEELGIEGMDLNALTRLPTEKIVAAQTKLELSAREKGGDFPYGVFIDPETLPLHPLEAVRNGYAAEVKLMIGTNLDEAKLYSVLRPPSTPLNDRTLVQAVYQVVKGLGKDENFAAKMVETYRKVRKGNLPADPQDIMDAVMTDLRFRIPAVRWAEAQSAHQPDVYTYLFTFKTTAMNGVLGACHALEIPFVFGTLGKKPRGIYPPRSPETDRLSDYMMKAWTSFARFGKPDPSPAGPWEPYETSQRKTMILGSDPHPQADPFGPERALWDGMF